MMRALILWSLVFVAISKNVLANYNSTIEKRQICSNNGCNACDGRSCNTCNNNDCCSSVTCNQCVNSCTNDCGTSSCRRNCVSGCTNSCQSSSCPVQSCSQCVNKCSNQCSTNQCVKDCANTCTECKEKETEPPIIVEPSNVIVNNTNNNLVNLTTHVNINNVVNNFNNISVPVYVNTTNINNIGLVDTDETRPVIVKTEPSERPMPFPYIIPYPVPSQNENCCYVMHPRQCYTQEDGNKRCYIRRHRECSDACTSPVVTIQETENISNPGCQYIRNYPYAYCGNYERRNCGQCYTCNGNYNPSECSRQSECSDVCRRSIPNCVPSLSGLQCY